MIVYEVNLEILPEIAEAYHNWLREHVVEMKDVIAGLKSASIYKRNIADEADGGVSLAEGTLLLTVQYQIEKRESLDVYFKEHAAAMRQKAFDAFGEGKFKATRRILNLEDSF